MKFDYLSLLQAVSEVFGVSADAIRHRGRCSNVAFARQVAMTIARDHGLSSGVVGRRFLRDHATVLHACRVVRAVVRDRFDPRRLKVAAAVQAYRRISAQNQPTP